MNDHEALDALRRANPVPDPCHAFPPDHPAALALFEEITTMTVTETPAVEPRTPSPTPIPSRPTARRRWALATTAVAGLAAAAAVAFATGGGSGSEPAEVADPGLAGGISPAGPGMAMCVEMYDESTILSRETAFDGTVSAVDGDSVTFSVNEWFKGAGQPASITLQGAEALGTISPDGAAVGLTPGSRLLVAGDGGFAWGCGFTQPFQPATAGLWRDVLR